MSAMARTLPDDKWGHKLREFIRHSNFSLPETEQQSMTVIRRVCLACLVDLISIGSSGICIRGIGGGGMGLICARLNLSQATSLGPHSNV